MDFVDLDKVLDEFEEEEKAAIDITPGQEIKPSGYAQFVESHLDRPWETLAKAPVGNNIISTIHDDGNISINYDDPYQGERLNKLDYITTNEVKKLEQLGLDNSDYGFSTTGKSLKDVIVSNIQINSHGYVISELNCNKDVDFESLKDGDSSSLLSSQNSLKLKINGELKNESVSHLRASQVTAVQTDALSPNSEQELSSLTYPKSDIIVEGHEENKISVDKYSGPVNGVEISPISQILNDKHSNNSCGESSTFSPNIAEHPSCNVHSLENTVSNTEYMTTKDLENSNKPIGFNFDDTDITPVEMDDYLNDMTNQNAKMPSKNLSSEIQQSLSRDLPQSLKTELQQAYQRSGSELQQSHQSLDSDPQQTSQNLSSELQLAIGSNPEIQTEQGPCRDGGHGPVVVDIPGCDVYSSMEGAVGHSPECDSLEHTDFSMKDTITSLDFNRKGIVSDINISLSQDGDYLEIEQIINEPVSINEYDPSCVSMDQASTSSDNTTEIPVVPREVTGISKILVDSDYSNGPFSDSVQLRNQEQCGIGQGARPKEPSHMKRGRPNSLLGLSKVNLETPFSGALIVDSSTVENCDVTFDQQSSLQMEQDRTSLIDSDNPQTYGNQMNNAQSQLMRADTHNAFTVDVTQGENSFQRQTVDGSSSSEQISSTNVMIDDVGHLPVLRRSVDLTMTSQGQTGQTATRPHSWSPSGSASPQFNKSKRPSSLNIPPRGEYNPDEPRVIPGRTRGMLTPYPDEVQEDTDHAITEESCDNNGDMEAVSADAAENDDNSPIPSEQPPSPIILTNLGKMAPDWLPDSQAVSCMQCQARFTFTKRRHHCRACGKIFCSLCCSMKSRLGYMELREARVCLSCHQVLQAAEIYTARVPHPNNPSDYCSTIPPSQQVITHNSVPTVLVPSGVLKRDGSQRRTGEAKQVMFSDGIRPGGDLTELDGSAEHSLPFRRTGRIQKKVEKQSGGQSSPKTRRLKAINNQRNMLPEDGLPPLYIPSDGTTEYKFIDTSDPSTYLLKIKDVEAEPVIFAVNRNLFVLVKMLNLECCVKRSVWCFTSKGMCTVGQNEIVILLEDEEDELSPPRDIFQHFSNVYEEASNGNVIKDLGYSVFNHNFLGSREHGGFLYISPTFQCLQKLVLPEPPYLFGILLQKWETPWAKVFPLRLLLRLGAEYRYYPCPLVSIRNRKPVFFEIGHTIMNLLADFRNYQYMLPQNKGVYIHMEDKKTMISFPRNRYDDLMKVVNNSNEHVMALGASFSTEADSHLVCIQNDEGNYQTQAINIQNKTRKVTGASFVVFNGALKSSSGLTAKSSIVEDGLMVQITLDSMNALKQAIKDMLDYTIGCGSIAAPQPEEIVCIQWVEEDRLVNIGVKSPIDGTAMDTVESVRVHKATDYVGENRSIRWTEVFFIQNEDTSSRWEPVDLSRLGEMLANAFCIAMTPHLDRLKEATLSKLGLRVNLDSEQVGYEIGGNNEKIPDFYMNDLDTALIPVIHGAVSQNQEGPIIMELIFHILE